MILASWGLLGRLLGGFLGRLGGLLCRLEAIFGVLERYFGDSWLSLCNATYCHAQPNVHLGERDHFRNSCPDGEEKTNNTLLVFPHPPQRIAAKHV